MFKHKCIKCGATYEDKDEDPYLCESCNEQRLAVAREIDKQHNTVGATPQGFFTKFEETAKQKGVHKEFIEGGIKRSQTFISAKDYLNLI